MNITKKFNEKPWALRKNVFESFLNSLKGSQLQKIVSSNGFSKEAEEKQVEVIKLRGILSKEMDFFSYLFGSTNIEDSMNQFRAALNNNDITAIILDIDSPGGDVNGAPEFAELIYNSRGIKPIIAYVGFDGASAAYWIASAADMIIVQEAAAVGSIGVLATFFQGENYEGEVTVVSSVSPDKYIDLNADEGIARIQGMVDEFGDIFVDNVAKYRGVSREIVLSDFGQGDVVFAKKAVERGMADMVGTFEVALMQVSANNINKRGGNMLKGKKKAQGEEINPDDVDRKWLEENKPELVDEIKEDQAQGETVNVDDISLDWLRENKPELVDEIKEGAQDEERERIEEVEEEEENSEDVSEEARAIWKSAKFKDPIKAAEAVQKVHHLSAERRKKLKGDRHKDAEEIPAVAAVSQVTASEDSIVAALKAGIKSRRVN